MTLGGRVEIINLNRIYGKAKEWKSRETNIVVEKGQEKVWVRLISRVKDLLLAQAEHQNQNGLLFHWTGLFLLGKKA